RDLADIADIPPRELKLLMVDTFRRLASEAGVELAPTIIDSGVVWAEPLGVLVSDHVGYVSFDLKRLQPEVQVMLAEAVEALQGDPDTPIDVAILIHP